MRWTRIKPLTGYVLIVVLPDELREGDIFIPERSSSQDRRCRKGIVREIGPWKKSSGGFGILPPFGIGATVIVSEHSGQKLNGFDSSLRLIKSDDILAVMVDS